MAVDSARSELASDALGPMMGLGWLLGYGWLFHREESYGSMMRKQKQSRDKFNRWLASLPETVYE
jgi:hypothetical protein